MAKKRKNGRAKENPFDYISIPQIDIDPDVKRGIFAVLVLAVGGVSLLSLFGLAGVAGEYLGRFLLALFGWGRWLFPFILLGFGFIMYSETRKKLRGANYLGLFLFIISIQTLFHLLIAFSLNVSAESLNAGGEILEQWKDSVGLEIGGGYSGLFLASGFIKLMGLWASFIVMLGLFLVALMLLFNTTLSKLIGRDSWFAKIIYFVNYVIYKLFYKLKEAGDELKEDEEEEKIMEEEEEEIDLGFSKKKVTARVGKVKAEPPYAPAIAEAMADKEAAEKIGEKEVFKQSYVRIDLPLDLLSGKMGKPTSGDIKNNAEIIKRTLDKFGIPVEMGEVSVGPTVTQFTFKPAEGIKLSRITALNNDLALALAAHPIRIEAPIPGKALVGIEVPNQTKAIVGLREILSDSTFKDRKTNTLIALGKDVSGKAWLDDLAKMPHLLVAGATNSGKSVCLNAIIVSLLYQNDPDDLKFIMVDPKKVELPVYNGIPHLFTPVITDVAKTINALKWCLNEMDRRFELLAKYGKRNIQSYNQSTKNGDRMPYIIFVIDELADLMVVAARDVEPSIIRLAQMARAVGIHLILATQRPSVNVITGVIKANMPARIAFAVASGIDSRTILDSLGAEKLLGRGDMLFSTAEISKPRRLQGAYVSDNEIRRVVNYIKEKSGEPFYVEGITERQKVSGIGGVGLDGSMGDDDELLGEAKELVINSGKASASYLQRRLSIGYARAAKLLDLLEEAGVIGPGNGAKPREIMISKDEYENLSNQAISGISLHRRDEAEAPDNFLPPVFADEEEDGEDDASDTSVDTRRGASLQQEDEDTDEDEIKDEGDNIDGVSDELPVHAEIQEYKKTKKQENEESKKNGQGGDDLEDEGKFFSR